MKRKIIIIIGIFFLIMIMYQTKICAADYNPLKAHIKNEKEIINAAYSQSENRQTINEMRKKLQEENGFTYSDEKTTSTGSLTISKVQSKVLNELKSYSKKDPDVYYCSPNWYDHDLTKLDDSGVFPKVFLIAAWRYNITLYRTGTTLYCAVATLHHYGIDTDPSKDRDGDLWDDNMYIYLFSKDLSMANNNGANAVNILNNDSNLQKTMKNVAKVKGFTKEAKIPNGVGNKETVNIRGVSYELYKNKVKVEEKNSKKKLAIEFVCYDYTDRLLWYNFSEVDIKGKTDKQIEEEEKQNLNNQQKKGSSASVKAVKLASASTGEPRSAVDFDDVLSDTSKYKPDENAMDANSAKKIEGATSKILTTISNVGIVVAVIMLAILGIKYMIGSVEEKAQYKEDMLPYVIGAFILFGITGLVKILIAIGNKIN